MNSPQADTFAVNQSPVLSRVTISATCETIAFLDYHKSRLDSIQCKQGRRAAKPVGKIIRPSTSSQWTEDKQACYVKRSSLIPGELHRPEIARRGASNESLVSHPTSRTKSSLVWSDIFNWLHSLCELPYLLLSTLHKPNHHARRLHGFIPHNRLLHRREILQAERLKAAHDHVPGKGIPREGWGGCSITNIAKRLQGERSIQYKPEIIEIMAWVPRSFEVEHRRLMWYKRRRYTANIIKYNMLTADCSATGTILPFWRLTGPPEGGKHAQ